VADWLETYRGVVNPWECDVVQHFNITFYFDRFADASRNFLDLVGVSNGRDAGMRNGSTRGVATFQHELRAGAGFHILTAVTRTDATVLELGHQVVDSTTGNTVTWFTETFAVPQTLPEGLRRKLAASCVPWPGPKTGDRPAPGAHRGKLTARDRVKPWEIGEDGTMSLPACVLRFSGAALQALTAIGMSGAYMQEQRRGFSTFELDLTRMGEATTGEMVDVTTAVSHLGKSSIRLAHRMTGAQGREIAFLTQSGVHLDMDARRSTPFPDELRASAQKLLGPG
jgi:acyl-CoA thioesterase FadM